MEVKRKMVSATELRKKPVLLDVRLQSDPGLIRWYIDKDNENEYAKLEHMSGKDCINHMLTDPDMIVLPEEDPESIKDAINDFIEHIGRGNYSIATEGTEDMVCAIRKDGSIFEEDERNNNILDYLIKRKDDTQRKEDYFYQELTIVKPRFLGHKHE